MAFGTGLWKRAFYIDNAVQIETCVNQAGELASVSMSSKVLSRIDVLFLLTFGTFQRSLVVAFSCELLRFLANR